MGIIIKIHNQKQGKKLKKWEKSKIGEKIKKKRKKLKKWG